ncbi:carbohydrate ABC transporter membrane protein 2, CUT1 family [Jiangella alba]|uniref:Carbohydrate ABC transporter membrane protein 2, CUT1 family n=2 Tax=Jiangella alba TaxID=561176 RepID=A0A1H5JCW3_9ACTN|nr:carbohydrate ABC transporter membrane protein 2, CUT1 family [Jiangella alba]
MRPGDDGPAVGAVAVASPQDVAGVAGPAAADRRVSTRTPGWRSIVEYVLLVTVAAIFLVPLVYMVTTSLKPPDEVFSTPPSLFGSELRWQNYVETFEYAPFGRYLMNSLLVAVLGTVLNVTVAVLSGYAFARLLWRGRTATFGVFLMTMMLPQEVIVVPLFVIMQRLGWVNSYQALIVPLGFAAFGAFLLRQFYLTVPRELDEAARVDGASVPRVFASIVLPLARPTVAVLAVFTFIGYWNAFMWPLIIVNDVGAYGTVPLGLQSFLGQQGSQWHLVMAASTVSMLPMIALVIALQKHLVSGVMASGFGGR